MIQFCLLASGSSGNATWVSDGTTSLLVDAGRSYKHLHAQATAQGVSLDGLDAILVTHEHGDHVAGLRAVARKTGATVYASVGTQQALAKQGLRSPQVRSFEAGATLSIGGFSIESFSVAHDASDPVGYAVRSNGTKLGFATDLGHVSTLVESRLAGSHALVLESNYCPTMLREGPYPAVVQHRIRSRNGHLSNQKMTQLLDKIVHDRLELVVLVHISDNNNTHELARSMAEGVLGMHPARLFVAGAADTPSVFRVGGS